MIDCSATRSDFSILRQHGAIYLGYSCAGKSFVYLYPCGKFAHTVAYPANIRLFRIDSSIHFISRLLTAIFPTTNHLGTFAAWDSARFLFLFFHRFYQSCVTSSPTSSSSSSSSPSRGISLQSAGTDSVPIGVQNVADTGNRYRRRRQPATKELNRVRIHTSCKCTPFQPLMPMTCSLIGTKS